MVERGIKYTIYLISQSVKIKKENSEMDIIFRLVIHNTFKFDHQIIYNYHQHIINDHQLLTTRKIINSTTK